VGVVLLVGIVGAPGREGQSGKKPRSAGQGQGPPVSPPTRPPCRRHVVHRGRQGQTDREAAVRDGRGDGAARRGRARGAPSGRSVSRAARRTSPAGSVVPPWRCPPPTPARRTARRRTLSAP